MSDRVVHIIWTMDIGGAERALYQLVREQRRLGMDVDIVVGRSAGIYGELAQQIGATVHELGHRRSFDLSVAGAARAILNKYTIAHFHSAEVGLIHIASGIPGLRRYYTHRAGIFSYPLKQSIRYRVTGYYLRKYFQGISGNTHQAAVAASRLFDVPLRKIVSTYNGLDFSLLKPERPRDEVVAELGGPPGAIRIGTSANLRPCKRIELLLEALAAIGDPRLQGVIIGDGPSRALLERMADRLGISGQVVFTGRKTQVADYLQALDIFVLPSGPEESFGNSAVEAMGVGIATVVFADGGGLTEHIVDGETGYVVRDSAEFSRRLSELAADPELRQRIGERGRKVIREKYSVESMVQQYSEFYQSTTRWNE